MLDLENNLKDETTEKKRLEREIKQKDRENQTALTEVSLGLSSRDVFVYGAEMQASSWSTSCRPHRNS